jgi:uncharacterized membrane protein YkvA (DUF1232 family)
MSDTTTQYLETFAGWLKNLSGDVRSLFDAARSEEFGIDSQRYLVGSINYLFKSLDLIPDGIDDIGYLDDAFVLRIGARAALQSAEASASEAARGPLEKLAADTALIDEFLGPQLATRLEDYVAGLRRGAARGRTVEDLLSNANLMRDLEADVLAFGHDFSPPSFAQDEKNLVKLKAFLDAKLPSK